MDERIVSAVGGTPAWIVGGSLRDELLGRDVVDVDVACTAPESAALAYAAAVGGAVFPLSEQHGAWRVALRNGRTVDFTPLQGGSVEADLATRDFTVNALARPVEGGRLVDPFGGRADLEACLLRAVSPAVFVDDPLRLLRAVRLEGELGFRLDAETERLVREQAELVGRPAGERILGELFRLSSAGYARLHELDLLAKLGARARSFEVPSEKPDFLLVWFLGEEIERLPISNELRRYARTLLRARPPGDASPRQIHRFRRATEPWALDALAFLGCGDEFVEAVEAAREGEPREPLLRGGDLLELGVAPGPELGRLLELVDEERAAGTIATRDAAVELVRRELAARG